MGGDQTCTPCLHVSDVAALDAHPPIVLQGNTVGQILFVGAPQAGKYSLVSCLLSPAKTLSKQSEFRQIWHLDTKYYTTAVSISRLHPATQATEQALLSQGLLLVFDATSEASFVAVSKWAALLPKSVGDIRLCIANRVDQLPRQSINKAEAVPELQRSSWLQAAQLWCTDNQFEYIEASSTDRKLDENLVWDEQQQGVCRIKQALEANYWPGLEMKQHQPQPTAPDVHGCQGPSQIAVTNGTMQSAETASASSGNTESDPNAFEDFQSADEADLDQFDTMFGELRATRDRLQHLPRDQRQLAAADVALRIAAILGLNEESDDEESS
ncbi:MAG: hypothetical protein FRX49_12025 [Trebouxia sp. A1-2]|nr:MAG: hypothetical protein FRX49_12025 [Trebouxia sp. A1-2]